MDRTRTASQGVGAAGAFDARAEAALPVRVDDRSGMAAPGKSRAQRSWLGIAARVVRDAAVAVAFMTLVPIVIVGVRGANAWGNGNFGNSTRAKLALVEVSRPLSVPTDPTITPMQAGLAYNALQPLRESSAFPLIDVPSRPDQSWQNVPLTPDMFVNRMMTFGFRGPSSVAIQEAVKGGFTPKETAYLRTLAMAPAWKAFDLVARAPAVDILGGSFKIPFPADVNPNAMRTDYKALKELAYASVSRAAYHLSIGQRDSAEAALRSIVSFGFAMIDNGHTSMDEFMGNVTVAVGRDALRRFYAVTNDPRSSMPALAPQPKFGVQLTNNRISVDEMRKFLIAEAANPNEHLGMRYEAVRLLSASSCTNVTELMFGSNSDVTDAIRRARIDLARYPSEKALIDLLAKPQEPRMDEIRYAPIQALAVSSATVAGVVLHNPRLAACTRMVADYYGGPW
ncbi:MAG: hypothetical protein ABIT20_20480 [Gemmatimonadaceae bacterium]